MKLICVPLTQAAMKRLDYNENIEGDLMELNLLQEDYEILENIGYFDNLNKQLGLMIDD